MNKLTHIKLCYNFNREGGNCTTNVTTERRIRLGNFVPNGVYRADSSLRWWYPYEEEKVV